MSLFPIYDLSSASVDPERPEPEGTKAKFWFEATDELAARLGVRVEDAVLYKFHRLDQGRYRGEDWAEKIAAELAGLLGLPAAQVDLARYDGRRGIVSPSFLRRESPTGNRQYAALTSGDRLLQEDDPDYPIDRHDGRQFRRVSRHTLASILAAIDRRPDGTEVGAPRTGLARSDSAPAGGGVEVRIPASFFMVGYLMLDAWIANTDRHHGNWGVVQEPSGGLTLAPTFDHAASLGASLLEAKRAAKLTGGVTMASRDSPDPPRKEPAQRSSSLNARRLRHSCTTSGVRRLSATPRRARGGSRLSRQWSPRRFGPCALESRRSS
ncbi:hypothetical protein [Engelhardtia mirabilis]|uniref:HipA-like C-terminal domain-containing protein n=1 Tax=Engelhardtia mirabilis TaxID=2528011 RepID=A0A518BIC7_9BACT|nr:hypothetical protein Pla133_17900 [Planctomycetes bacterium Pla133]QDV01040.1 hypothetical protein Pla86_17890 [Planctomycetes bacterium Pla86]